MLTRANEVKTIQTCQVQTCQVQIGGRPVGPGAPAFIIAEAGSNHDGRFGQAVRLINAAAMAGADAVKFQAFNLDRFIAREAYQQALGSDDTSWLEQTRAAELPIAWLPRLAAHCREAGAAFLATPFDAEAADALERAGAPAFKVASGDLTHLPLLRHLARKGKPILLSTGMATIVEVAQAIEAIRGQGNQEIALLHCVVAYPAQARDTNLACLVTMREAFGLPVGLSDHTLGIEVAIAAAALGASLVEKHFTLDRRLIGPDHGYALEPDELGDMVAAIRRVESALGSGEKRPLEIEAEELRLSRRGAVAACDIAPGAPIQEAMVEFVRPAAGIAPAGLHALIGRRARSHIRKGEVLTWDRLSA